MNEFEKELMALLHDIKGELASIRETMIEAIRGSEQTSSELFNSVFGLLQQSGDEETK